MCREGLLSTGARGKLIAVVMVPRRGLRRPVALIHRLGKYPQGTVWICDCHEALEASWRHFIPVSARNQILTADATATPIHRSLPPSSSTVRDFVGQRKLLRTRWYGLIFGDLPRAYLDGPGGSGKTTLAFEFARLLTEFDLDFRLPNGEGFLDYVVFISAKEIELNPQTGKQQRFAFRNFSTAHEQLAQIAFHSGMLDQERIVDASELLLQELLRELFANFNGLIVMDDIDTLRCEGKDTGEEVLFLKAATCPRRTRILYTVRFPPTYALRNSITVPGLDYDKELVPFVETCCKQFNVPLPSNDQFLTIYEASSGLPLIIEEIIWIRKYAGSYPDAINQYKERGGEETRRYLYQREYDRLESAGKSQYVLALLYLVGNAVSFLTIVRLSNYTGDKIRTSLTECAGIFLSTNEVGEEGETLYSLTPPSIPFIGRVSQNLSFFDKLKRVVEHFKRQGKGASTAESAVIVTLDRLLRQRRV